MSTHTGSPARQTGHAGLYKMPSPTVRSDETWKDRYRLHCKQQFKRARDKIVNKMRQLSFDDNQPTLSAQDIVESEWIKMFGSLPRATSMDMDRNNLSMSAEDAEFEANWAIMNEIRRELELEQLQSIPDEQPEYVPSIDEFNQTQCPICTNDSLFQFSANYPITCRQCSFQYQLKAGSLDEIHAYHRQTMSHCHETKLYTTLWHSEDGSVPALLLVCTKCDFSFCL
ncbi:unnamed protein product [Rotaria socialis]|uniref:RPA-interacting protein C-terminal domain-containing protein n=2 Tax=Rotaria socialis TaxID=392032 RepID=A0A821IZF9_9BILA|nr:unnamed protein product [Rotaria socialis]CAF3349622.1 unnamed protein product [Rotaria socialis]CAF3395836.1 unnamed protein product [Rotaria socialis]CAF3444646.1 unnamed protein product [Rotaria socialis]CAF4399150.1 unnamed protein product [Rotaria socialis]